jgi:dCTP deaminase
MVSSKQRFKGFSWGLTECGYDIRIKQRVVMYPGHRFVLGSSIEEFDMPDDLMGRILNKSTWARLGVDASITTNIEPGWKGFLTIELHYMKLRPIVIPAGVGIAQVIFESITTPTGYIGKYQNQENKPIAARR